MKTFPKADGSRGYNIPEGCDDDPTGECQKMNANPNEYFKKDSPPKNTKPTVTIGPDGKARISVPPGCDKACAMKFYQEFLASNPHFRGK